MPFHQQLACTLLCTALLLSTATLLHAQTSTAVPEWMPDAIVKLEQELVARYGAAEQPRVHRGLQQVAGFWRVEDGDAAAFADFVLRHYAGDAVTRQAVLDRFERVLEQIDGNMNQIMLASRWQVDLDLGPIQPVDEIFAGFDPSAHLDDDFFANKLAFVVLLNFPLTTLAERLHDGPQWTRQQWAEVRLAQRFARRVPAEVNQAIAAAGSAADQYISEYNIWMHHLLDDQGRRLFPAGLRLLSHWNLRDEIRAQYSNRKDGLPRQRMIQKVMEHIVTQTIPAVVVNNPHVDWNPRTNVVQPAAAKDSETPVPATLKIENAPEPDTRYATLLSTFLAARQADPYSPTAPTLMARRFDEDRELPEERVQAMLEQVLASPLIPRVGRLIASRLGRPLEPFDIWYNGFRPRGQYTEAQLDEIVARKYPTATAFAEEIPQILTQLGFAPERAQSLAGHIAVDPARGSGHAWGAQMRTAKSHLRTRVGRNGMDYKGFNIAIHELGHNVEQTISLHDVDHTLLQGVPNTAFTEALAFVFQNKDLELLGLAQPGAESEALQTLHDFWGTYEIAGVALVDMAVWHWMYEHPNATPAELKQATVRIAQDLWNKYYAPVFKHRDVVLLGIYSHMIDAFLYLPDYPIGHLIAHQIREQIQKSGDLGVEFERMARAGRIAPDLWMMNATGAPVGAEVLLAAAERALAQVATKKSK